MLTTLAKVQTLIGLESPTASETAALKHLLRRGSALIRAYCRRWHGAAIESNSVAAATVVTCYGHGLQSGDIINVFGSNSTPTIDGERTVTVLTEDTFTVAVTVTAAGTTGQFSKRIDEYLDGDGGDVLQLPQRPVRSVSSIWVDPTGFYGQGANAFADSTLLTAGTDYVLQMQSADQSMTGTVLRLNGSWPSTRQQVGLVSVSSPSRGSIKVRYFTGWKVLPSELQLAAELVVADLYRTAASGAAMASESLDYYSYTRLTADEEAKALHSAKSLLARQVSPLA